MKTATSGKPTLSKEELQRMDAYWRAANYLSVGQIYLHDNPLLKKPLTLDHIKLRLLGHWGTTPGLNFLYVHLNRMINKHDLSMIYIAGPGHTMNALPTTLNVSSIFQLRISALQHYPPDIFFELNQQKYHESDCHNSRPC